MDGWHNHWIEQYSKRFESTDDSSSLISNELELLGLILDGIFNYFQFESNSPKDSISLPWKLNLSDEQQSNPKLLKFSLSLLKNDQKFAMLSNWNFEMKIMSMSSQIFIINIASNMLHPVTLENVKNSWRIMVNLTQLKGNTPGTTIFTNTFKYKQNYSQTDRTNRNQALSNLFKLETDSYRNILSFIYDIFYEKFWVPFLAHNENIVNYSDLEGLLRKDFEMYVQQRQIIPMFSSNAAGTGNKNRFANVDRKLTEQQLQHIHLCFLCHLILSKLHWETMYSHQENENVAMETDEPNDQNEEKKGLESDLNINDTNESVISNLVRTARIKTENGQNSHKYGINGSNDNIELTAVNIVRTLSKFDTFNPSYKVKIPKTISRASAARAMDGEDGDIEMTETEFKNIQVKYCPMGHCALIIVKDETLLESHIRTPRVQILLKDYVSKNGEIMNLSGKKSLIKLLSNNLVKRAIDPFCTLSQSLDLFCGMPMSCLSYVMKFLSFQDLIKFGNCSQLGYHIAHVPQMWKEMYQRYFPDSETKDASNWKNVFKMEILEQKQNLEGLSASEKEQIEQQRMLPQSNHFRVYLTHLGIWPIV